MNPEEIASHLEERGYEASLNEDGDRLFVSFAVGDDQLTLQHVFPKQILKLPSFQLVGAGAMRTLAHVVPMPESGDGIICVGDSDSVSVNFEVPTLAYEASLERHIKLLRRLIEDPEWNRAELIREFHSNWDLLCYCAGTQRLELFCGASAQGNETLQVRKPDDASKGKGICGNYLGLPQHLTSGTDFDAVRRNARWDHRQVVGKAIVLSLARLDPAPTKLDNLPEWYVSALKALSDDSRSALARFRKRPGKDFWLVFVSPPTNGATWFCVRLATKAKAKLPLSAAECNHWSLQPICVRPLTLEALVPRGGGSLDLTAKSVLLIGCGSVGSEIAHRITSSGVGRLVLSDPDKFSEKNLYRHTLSIPDIDYLKSVAIEVDLRLKHPWAVVESRAKRLEEYQDPEELQSFDLIIIAIGSPTKERFFYEYCRRVELSTPVLNTWVEAYGIGGHATLCIPGSNGCLRCAYVDPETLAPGLSSNLNFLAPNQDLLLTRGGCGNQFLPYSGVAASYTATMATNMAVQYLTGEVVMSSKMSWKGSAAEAQRQNLNLTHRYHNFERSLEVLPLHNPECDVCKN